MLYTELLQMILVQFPFSVLLCHATSMLRKGSHTPQGNAVRTAVIGTWCLGITYLA